MGYAAWRTQLLIVSELTLVLAAATLVFWSALDGPFLFDDFHNLSPLADGGGVTDLQRFLNFVFGGEAGALGRPLSLVTFLINDFTWPSDPWSFKYTNLLIHLINGLLVFVLTRQLARLVLDREGGAQATAVAATALWLVHPMHISTMMPVIQRMTELSATWTLAGAIAYLYGRRLAAARPAWGYVWMSLGVGLGGILATLSKENGVLLPLYVLVVEATLLRGHALPRGGQICWRTWRGLFLILPLALLAGYFTLHWDGTVSGYARRGFTMSERLLTEPRILFDYLHQILIPHLDGSGLFHEDYPISRGLLSPPTTLLALLGLGGLLSASLWARRRAPLIAFAVLWFLAGHVLESSFIGLELYFEHRNYLPMLGLLFAVSFYAIEAAGRLRHTLPLFLAGYFALLVTLSWQSSQVWGDAKLLANVWAKENPTSVRAQQLAADYWFKRGQIERSQARLEAAATHNPNDVMIQLELVFLDCLRQRSVEPRLQAVLSAARLDTYQGGTFEVLDTLRSYVRDERCPALRFADLLDVDKALLENPRYTTSANYKAEILYDRAKIYVAQRRLNAAMKTLDHVYRLRPVVDVPLFQASLLLSADLPEAALNYIDVARQSETTGNYPFVSHNREISALEAAAKAMAEAEPAPSDT